MSEHAQAPPPVKTPQIGITPSLHDAIMMIPSTTKQQTAITADTLDRTRRTDIMPVMSRQTLIHKSSFTTWMLSQCQALHWHMTPHQTLKRVLSRLFIFKTSRMLCLKQNTKGGLPLNRIGAGIGISSITSLVRSAALMGASRPNLQVLLPVARRVTSQ